MIKIPFRGRRAGREESPIELGGILNVDNKLSAPGFEAGNINRREADEANTKPRVAPCPNEVNQEMLVPNGGYGWVCVACVFFLNSHTWGINSVSRKPPLSNFECHLGKKCSLCSSAVLLF